jgi:uncharacterized protein with PIN domain
MREHKPNEELIAGLFNFAPAVSHSIWAEDVSEPIEPFFSQFRCDTCGSELAGNRHFATATIGPKHTNARETLEICEDCYLYFFT